MHETFNALIYRYIYIYMYEREDTLTCSKSTVTQEEPSADLEDDK